MRGIGDGAFAECSQLKYQGGDPWFQSQVKFGDYIRRIGASAFQGCNGTEFSLNGLRVGSIGEAAFDGFDSVKCTCGAGGAAVLAQAVPGHREYEHGDAGVEGLAQLWLEDHDDEAEDLCPDAEQRDIREERRLVAQRVHLAHDGILQIKATAEQIRGQRLDAIPAQGCRGQQAQ